MDYGNPEQQPPAVKCHLNHEQAAVWREDRWVYPAKDECVLCIKQEVVAQDFDKWIKSSEKAGVPDIHQMWSTRAPNRTQRQQLYVDDYNRHVAAFARKWKWPRWVGLCGPVGVGKTSWATALFLDALELHTGLGGMWTTEMGFFRDAESKAAVMGHPGRIRHLDAGIKAPILLFDDLGASGRRPSDWQLSAIRDLVDQRHSNKRPTLFTTNLDSWKAVEKLYGAHIASRLRQAAGDLLRLDGPDRRLF